MAIKILSSETWRGHSLTNCVLSLNHGFFIRLTKSGTSEWTIQAQTLWYTLGEYQSDPRGASFHSETKQYTITDQEKNGDLPTIFYTKLKAEYATTEDI